MPNRLCDFAECGRPHYGHGLCQGHARQRRAGEDLRPLRMWASQQDKTLTCSISSCDSLRKGNQLLCANHYGIARQYNLSQSDYVAMYELGCQVCSTTEDSLAVDHDHRCCPEAKTSCGKCVRGLLCSKCNFMAGLVDKSGLSWQDTLSNLAWYYEQYDMWGHDSNFRDANIAEAAI